MVNVENRGRVQNENTIQWSRTNDKVGRRWDSENGIAWFGLRA